MKKIIYILLLLPLLTGCFEKNVTRQMEDIDSLVVREQYDSAYAAVLKINKTELTGTEDSAHYYLLLTQTSMLTHHPDTQNVLDSLVIPYYNKVENHEKLAEAYYYKAYGYVIQGKIPDATFYYKAAEEQAEHTLNLNLKYKCYESLSAINELSGNYLMQLNYAKKSLTIAKDLGNKEKEAYSYLRISLAYNSLQYEDSAIACFNKTYPLLKNIKDENKPTFLNNAAYALKQTSPKTAKKYLEESLSLKEQSLTMEHLADIFYFEGKEDEAYNILLKALYINDDNPKDNILHNLLDYDIEHGRTEHVCEMVNEIIHIKDSMLNSLRNDTIKDLQLRFDHEVAMRRQERITGKWQKGALSTVIIILLMGAYILFRRYKEKNRKQEVQMQINDFMNQIHDLEASGKESEEEIAKLNKKINDYMDDKAPDLLQGRLYYEQIKADEIKTLSNSNWKRKDEQQFIDYYTAIDYRTVNRLKRLRGKRS